MKNKVPNGLLELQWNAIISGLEGHPSTINDYRKVVNLLHAYDNGKFRIYNMSKNDAIEYFDYLENKANLSSNTIHRYEATLRSIATKMENNQIIFKDYKNPFSGLIKKDVRKKTKFSKSMFASPNDIYRILVVLKDQPLKYQLMFKMMIEIGLSPNDICNLKVNQFHSSLNNNDIYLTFQDGTIFTHNSYDNENYKIKKIATSKNGNISYNTNATFHFYNDFSDELRKYIKDLGNNNDNRFFFMTSRHQAYTYRSIHQALSDITQKAGIKERTITPNQLSLFGIVHSYLVSEELKYYYKTKNLLSKENNRNEIIDLKTKLKQSETMFYYLSKTGWHGSFQHYYPLSNKQIIDSIIKNLGKNYLYDIVILKKQNKF